MTTKGGELRGARIAGNLVARPVAARRRDGDAIAPVNLREGLTAAIVGVLAALAFAAAILMARYGG